MSDWKKVSDELPPDDTVVMTKIDDEKGCRNVQALKLCRRLWFIPDGSMYVYYVPTHWATLPTPQEEWNEH